MLDFLTWTLWVVGTGVTVFGTLFSCFVYFNKRGSPKKNVFKKSFRYCFLAIIFVYVLGLFFIVEWDPEEKHATKKDIEQLREDISNLSNPIQEEVKSEIDKRLANEFEETNKKAHELFQKGLSAYNNKAFNTAISHFEKAINVVPLSSFYVYKGNSYFMTSQIDHAIADYTKAVELNPNYEIAFNNRGYALGKKDDYHQAIEDYTKAIELNSKYIEAYNNRGCSYVQIGQFGEAITDYNEIISINPDHVEAYYNRGHAWYKKGNFDKAIADYNKAINLNQDYAKAYNNRGLAWFSKNVFDHAIADYTKAVELNPNYEIAYYNRSIAYYKKNDLDQAIRDNRKVIELNAQNANACYNLACFNALLKRPKVACEWLRKAIKLKEQFRENARVDQDFDKIRESDCFKKLIV